MSNEPNLVHIEQLARMIGAQVALIINGVVVTGTVIQTPRAYQDGVLCLENAEIDSVKAAWFLVPLDNIQAWGEQQPRRRPGSPRMGTTSFGPD